MAIAAADWARGIGYSILASIIGGASKLAIRKSWLMVQNKRQNEHDDGDSSDDQDCSSRSSDGSNSNSNVYFEISQHNSNSASSSSTTSMEKWALLLRLFGMIGMTFLNPLFCVLAMNYASPSILAPFSGLTLVWIVLFSETMIGEKPQWTQIVAAALIILGEVIVAIFGDHTNDEGVDLEHVLESYENVYFQAYFVFMILWLGGIVYMIHRPRSATLRRFAWGAAGGSVTGFQNFLKDSLTIKKAVAEEGLPLPWYFYLMALLAIATSFGGLLFLTACMKRYDATFSAAMFVGSFVLSASLMSAVHYDTFQHLVGFWNWVMYPLGLIILMIGVNLLVKETREVEVRDQSSAHDNASAPMQTPLVLDDEQMSYA